MKCRVLEDLKQYEDRMVQNDYIARQEDEERLDQILGDANNGDQSQQMIVCEGATDAGDALFEFAAWGIGSEVNEINFKRLMTVDAQEGFVRAALKLRSQIINYINQID